MKNIKITLLLVIFGLSVKAQYPSQMMFYDNLPQSKYLSPGDFPEYSGFFYVPGLSNISLSAGNSGFALKDAFVNGTLSPDAFVGSLADQNLLNTGFATDLLGFGFRFKKNFFSFNVTPRVDVDFAYNKAFFNFLVNGNGAFVGKKLSLDGFAFDFSSFVETGFGYTRQINEKLTVGGRAKVLLGIANASGDLNGISLFTDANDYSISATSGLSFNTYGSFLQNDSIREVLGNPSEVNPKNLGFGLDFGGTYQFSEKLSFFANISDLGFIRWADYGEEFYNDSAVFKFEGAPYDELIGSDDDMNTNNDEGDYFSDLSDSLVSVFELQRRQVASYSTRLKTRIYVGADYEINKRFDANGMLGGRFFNGRFYPNLMGAVSFHAKKWLTLRATYSSVNRTYDNLGFGAVLHLGAFQLYAMADNLYGLTQVDYAQNMNGAFGINFTFKGASDEKKAKREEKKAEKKADKKDKKSEKKQEEKNEAAEDKAEKKADKIKDKAKADAKETKKKAKKKAEKIEEQADYKANKVENKADDKAAQEVKKAEKEAKKAERQAKNEAQKIKETAAMKAEAKSKNIEKVLAEDKFDEKVTSVQKGERAVVDTAKITADTTEVVNTSIEDSIMNKVESTLPSFDTSAAKPVVNDSVKITSLPDSINSSIQSVENMPDTLPGVVSIIGDSVKTALTDTSKNTINKLNLPSDSKLAE